MRRGGLVSGLMICAVALCGMMNTGCDELVLSQVVGAIASELESSGLDISSLGGLDGGGSDDFGGDEFDEFGHSGDDGGGFDDGGFDDFDDSDFLF